MTSSLFISDLHLQASEPALTDLAFALFQNAECEQLYILGDLFEYWVGDDSVDATAKAVAAELEKLVKRGTRICIMHGNRDFLLGEKYVSGFGGELIAEDTLLIDAGGQPTLLMHGDTLCSDDTEYQFYRRMVRNRDWQKDFLAKKVSEREATARMIRNTSKVKGERAHENRIANINEDTLLDALVAAKVSRVIHGHTHRPSRHTHQDGQYERLVLGDWRPDEAVVAVSDNDNCELVKWDGNNFTALDQSA